MRTSYLTLLHRGWIALAILLSSIHLAWSQDELSTIYLLDGRGMEGSLAGIEGDRLSWRLASGVGSTSIPLSSIDRIEFPEPQIWQEIMEAFEDGEYEKAAAAFDKIARQKTRGTFYPAPGNFATLSQRRLLDCYRAMRKWPELRYIARNIEWDKLPRAERDVEPLMNCWAAIGGSEWDKALELADEAAKHGAGWASELGLVRALAYKGKGDPNSAVIALAEIFGPYPGLDRELARDALREASTILANNPQRKPELHAMVHIYAALFGNGEIWEDAPPYFQELLKEPIQVEAPTVMRKKTAGAGGGKGAIMVRYVEIHNKRKGNMTLAEVQVFTDDGNVAGQGKASHANSKATVRRRGAERAIDGSIAGGTDANSYSETNGNVWKLDLGSALKVNEVVIWARGGPFMSELDGCDLILKDGAGKQVFSKTDIPFVDERNHTVTVNGTSDE